MLACTNNSTAVTYQLHTEFGEVLLLFLERDPKPAEMRMGNSERDVIWESQEN